MSDLERDLYEIADNYLTSEPWVPEPPDPGGKTVLAPMPVRCPDCRAWWPHNEVACLNCGLPWEDVEAADWFVTKILPGLR